MAHEVVTAVAPGRVCTPPQIRYEAQIISASSTSRFRSRYANPPRMDSMDGSIVFLRLSKAILRYSTGDPLRHGPLSYTGRGAEERSTVFAHLHNSSSVQRAFSIYLWLRVLQFSFNRSDFIIIRRLHSKLTIL